MSRIRVRAASLLGVGVALMSLRCDSSSREPTTVIEDAELLAVATNGTATYAAGKGGVIYSKGDSDVWSPHGSVFASLGAMAADDTLIAAVGAQGRIAHGAWAADVWDGRDLASIGAPALVGVGVCAGTIYVVGGGGFAASSTDGTSWKTIQGIDPRADLVGVACGPSSVLLASYSQASGHWLSTMGGAFAKVASPGDTCAVAWGNGAFLDLTVDGRVFRSPGAMTWTEAPDRLWTDTAGACHVAFGASTFAVVREDPPQIEIAGPGETWAPLPIPIDAPGPLTGVAIGPGGELAIVGPKGKFIQGHCSNGSCDSPTAKVAKVDLSDPKTFAAMGATDAGSPDSGGTCGPCATDADCVGVAQRHSVAGAACDTMGDHLCHACLELCSAGGTNCRCVLCSEPGGCGGATCMGTLCAFPGNGAMTCQ